MSWFQALRDEFTLGPFEIQQTHSGSISMATEHPDVVSSQDPEATEEFSGKKKSKFQMFKNFFTRKKKKEPSAAVADVGLKSSQSSENISKESEINTTPPERDEGSRSKISLGTKALSHDSVFVSDSSEANELLGTSQDSIHGKVKSLQSQLKQAIRMGSPPSLICVKKTEDAGTVSEDDGLPSSPPEYTTPHTVMVQSQSLISLEGPDSDDDQLSCAASSRAVSPLVVPADFSQPATSSGCLDNSAAKHRLGLRNKACNRRKPLRLDGKAEREKETLNTSVTKAVEEEEQPETAGGINADEQKSQEESGDEEKGEKREDESEENQISEGLSSSSPEKCPDAQPPPSSHTASSLESLRESPPDSVQEHSLDPSDLLCRAEEVKIDSLVTEEEETEQGIREEDGTSGELDSLLCSLGDGPEMIIEMKEEEKDEERELLEEEEGEPGDGSLKLDQTMTEEEEEARALREGTLSCQENTDGAAEEEEDQDVEKPEEDGDDEEAEEAQPDKPEDIPTGNQTEVERRGEEEESEGGQETMRLEKEEADSSPGREEDEDKKEEEDAGAGIEVKPEETHEGEDMAVISPQKPHKDEEPDQTRTIETQSLAEKVSAEGSEEDGEEVYHIKPNLDHEQEEDLSRPGADPAVKIHSLDMKETEKDQTEATEQSLTSLESHSEAQLPESDTSTPSKTDSADLHINVLSPSSEEVQILSQQSETPPGATTLTRPEPEERCLSQEDVEKPPSSEEEMVKKSSSGFYQSELNAISRSVGDSRDGFTPPSSTSTCTSSSAANTEESCVSLKRSSSGPFGVWLRKTPVLHRFSSEEEQNPQSFKPAAQPISCQTETPQPITAKPSSNKPALPKKPELHGDRRGRTRPVSVPASAPGVGSSSPSWISMAKQKQKIHEDGSVEETAVSTEEQERKSSNNNTAESTCKVSPEVSNSAVPANKEESGTPSPQAVVPSPPKPQSPVLVSPVSLKPKAPASSILLSPIPFSPHRKICQKPMSGAAPPLLSKGPGQIQTPEPKSPALSSPPYSPRNTPEKADARANQIPSSPRFLPPAPAFTQDEPPWMALAKKKAKAWSEMPQIVQ
ncbi:CRACD-like protein isoform X2 [Cheilinus undulatus]|uniref:CRACD-like protein isoform X2 n=1 Tax=Cheilinus undulatus TaxID=241271 RepID=UPI001BD44A2F|nr:CRACD-like protein isoform X2 [Cheilinus undulatus]